MEAGETARLLVIGSGPAAVAAARSYRESGGDGRVLLLTADADLPYERPPLSKDYLRGDVAEDEVAMQDTDFLSDRHVAVEVNTRVASLDPAARVVRLVDGRTVGYQTCVLATGSTPSALPVPGGDHPDVFLLRSLADARLLRAVAEHAKSAVVVGSGFIGCEAAASLAMRGLDVTLVTREERPQEKRLGPEVGDRILSWLREIGVSVVLGAELDRIEDGRRVHVSGRAPLAGDLVLTAVGVRPRSELAADAGVAVDEDRIVVDERMRTSSLGVLAAGDVAYARNAAAGRHLTVEHWGEAEEMGRIAGATAAGALAQWEQAPGFWSTIGERTLKYAAWGDGFDDVHVRDHGDGFTAWYGKDGVTVGVLTHERDADYERGRELVEGAAPLP